MPESIRDTNTGTTLKINDDGSINTSLLGLYVNEDGSINTSFNIIKLIDYDGDNPIYVGEAEPGSSIYEAKWKILKIDYVGNNPISVLFADGNTNFDNVWDDRTSLSYS